jgi:hypothetical protein
VYPDIGVDPDIGVYPDVGAYPATRVYPDIGVPPDIGLQVGARCREVLRFRRPNHGSVAFFAQA